MQRVKKIAVIGSGFGGLSAAIRLAASGHEVTIYERLDKWGGRAYQFEKDGFRFDAGPTVITAPHTFDELFALAGKQRTDYFKLIPLDPFYRVFNEDGRPFDYWRNPEKAAEEVAKFSPSDVEGFKKFVQGTVDIFNWFHPFTEKTFPTFLSFAKIFPHVLANGIWRNMYDYASQFVKDDFMRQVCSFHPLLVGGNPFDTPSIYGLIAQFEREWGVHFAHGGTGAIVDALGKLFIDCGGKIRFNAEVKEIVIRNKRASGVRLMDGSVDQADEVVCNADVAFAMNNMIPRDQRPASALFRLNNAEYSNSLVVIYFGTNRTYEESSLLHHNLVLGPSYRKLMRSIFDRKLLKEDLGLYIHMPSRTDRTICPEGCGSFYVLSLVPNLDGGQDWDSIMPRYVDNVLGFMEEKFLPGLSSSIVTKHAINPLYFKHALNSHKGAAFSIKPSMLQSGYFRPQVESSYFSNLYFVGAGVHPGAGVPAVMASGKIAAGLIDPVMQREAVPVDIRLSPAG
ncbi:MAG: phytoene desaturase family protein [Bacteroidota bacterium]